MAKPAQVTTGKSAAAAKGAEKPAPVAKAIAIVQPSRKALSLDVGPRIVANLAAIYDEDTRISSEVANLEVKRKDTLASLTMGIKKAAENDEHIAGMLPDVFSGEAKKINALWEILMLALGIREVKMVTNKDKQEVPKVMYTADMLKFFPGPKETKDDPEYLRKNTLRTNFLHQFKKAAQAAHGLIEKEIETKYDKKSGTLLLSGKEIKKHFGVDEVLLDEKQTITKGEGDNKQVTTLLKKPSYQEIARIGAATQGKVATQRKDSRAAGVVDADKALIALCDGLTKALQSYKGEITEGVYKALTACGNAITVVAERKAAA